jgi:formyltetrahydrofolate synthetase
VPSTHWQDGGAGAVAVGEALVRCCAEQPSNFKLLYPTEGTSIKSKIETVAREIYRADGVEYSEEAEKKLQMFEQHGLASLPVCIAKTQYSFTSDAEKLGAPRGFNITVRDVRAYTGAGLIVPLLGTIQTIPGLPTRPAYYDVDIDTETGAVIGLS